MLPSSATQHVVHFKADTANVVPVPGGTEHKQLCKSCSGCNSASPARGVRRIPALYSCPKWWSGYPLTLSVITLLLRQSSRGIWLASSELCSCSSRQHICPSLSGRHSSILAVSSGRYTCTFQIANCLRALIAVRAHNAAGHYAKQVVRRPALEIFCFL